MSNFCTLDPTKSGNPVDIRFKSTVRYLTIGPSFSGKTSFAYDLIKYRQELFELPPKRVIVFYSTMQPLYEKMSNQFGNDFIQFQKGLPTEEKVQNFVGQVEFEGQQQLIIIDDFTLELDKSVAKLFNVISHHHSCHVMALVHRLFSKTTSMRDISMSANYLILKKNPRDMSEYRVLARQLEPANAQGFLEILKKACDRPYGYLICNLSQTAKDTDKYLTDIFPEEYPPKLFLLE